MAVRFPVSDGHHLCSGETTGADRDAAHPVDGCGVGGSGPACDEQRQFPPCRGWIREQPRARVVRGSGSRCGAAPLPGEHGGSSGAGGSTPAGAAPDRIGCRPIAEGRTPGPGEGFPSQGRVRRSTPSATDPSGLVTTTSHRSSVESGPHLSHCRGALRGARSVYANTHQGSCGLSPSMELAVTLRSRSPEVGHARGQERDPGLPAGFRFHDLRHYFASLLIAGGADVKVVQARMRHASARSAVACGVCCSCRRLRAEGGGTA